jgi:hypothetical protein
VFGLGALLHHLLVGIPPESGSVAGSIPQIVRAVVTKALAQVPAQRFQSISAFAGALERATGLASPPKFEARSPPKKVRTGPTLLSRMVRVAASIPRITGAMVTKAWARVPAQRIRAIAASAGHALMRGAAQAARATPGIARAIVAMVANVIKGLVKPIRKVAASVGPRRLLQTAGAALIVLGIWLFWSSYREAIVAEVQASIQQVRRQVRGGGDSALHASSTPAPRPVPDAAQTRKPSTARAPKPANAKEPTPAQPLVSPYRRAHPWAAPPGGRFYFRSSCPEALRFPDLLFFMSEQEARAAGFVPTRVPGCH